MHNHQERTEQNPPGQALRCCLTCDQHATSDPVGQVITWINHLLDLWEDNPRATFMGEIRFILEERGLRPPSRHPIRPAILPFDLAYEPAWIYNELGIKEPHHPKTPP